MSTQPQMQAQMQPQMQTPIQIQQQQQPQSQSQPQTQPQFQIQSQPLPVQSQAEPQPQAQTQPQLQPPTQSQLQAQPQPHPIEPKRLQDLVNEVDPDEQLDEDVEEILLDIADEFIENVVSSACAIAKHRNSNSLEVDDVKLYLERKYKIWIPGFGESKPTSRRFTSEAHRQRMALINKQQDNRPAEDANKSQKK